MKNLLKSILDVKALKTDKKQLLFLSDDWGSIRIKSLQDLESLKKLGLVVNNRFDSFDSLETNEDLESLFEILINHRDYLGKHPVITAVTNVGNPNFRKIQDSNFKKYYYETIDQTYQRYPNSNKVLSLIKYGIEQRIFIPQSHGREHVQANWWLDELKDENSFLRNAFSHEYFFAPAKMINKKYRNRDFAASFDVFTNKDIESQKDIVSSSLKEFDNLFGFRSTSFTPPAMYYSPEIENTLFQEGISLLDVGRFFKVPLVGGGEKYQLNYLGKKKASGLRVLVRNGMFEPNLSESDNGVARALYDIERAFKASQPAILSNHRAAFVGRINKKNREKGLMALNELLIKVLKKWPNVEFITPQQLFF